MFHSLGSSERSDEMVSRVNMPGRSFFCLTNHVRAEESLSVSLEVGLVGIHHAVQPGQELLGAVICVEDNGDTVCRGNGPDVVGGSNATSNAGLLLAVGYALACKVCGTCSIMVVSTYLVNGLFGHSYLHCSVAG